MLPRWAAPALLIAIVTLPLAGAALRVVFSPSRLKVPDAERLEAFPVAAAEVPLVPNIRMVAFGPNSSPA